MYLVQCDSSGCSNMSDFGDIESSAGFVDPCASVSNVSLGAAGEISSADVTVYNVGDENAHSNNSDADIEFGDYNTMNHSDGVPISIDGDQSDSRNRDSSVSDDDMSVLYNRFEDDDAYSYFSDTEALNRSTVSPDENNKNYYNQISDAILLYGNSNMTDSDDVFATERSQLLTVCQYYIVTLVRTSYYLNDQVV